MAATGAMVMSTAGTEPTDLSTQLIERLACPACDRRPPVESVADGKFLQCTACKRKYPVDGGIPVMIVSEAILDE
jgi:uncharacterized protein YbaR (Trm112 family)